MKRFVAKLHVVPYDVVLMVLEYFNNEFVIQNNNLVTFPSAR